MRGHATIRATVFALLVASAAYAFFFAGPIVRTAGDIAVVLAARPEVVLAAGTSALLVLVGHALRAHRDRLLFQEVADTTVRTQFGAFAAGSLCNAVLPLKLGELVRADVIAQRYCVSFSFSLVLALVERFLDCAILLALSSAFVGFHLPLALATGILLVVLLVLYLSPRWFKKALAAMSAVLSERAGSRVLFAFWSLEYGLRRTIVARIAVPYILLAIANWVVYIAAFFPVLVITANMPLSGCIGGSVGAYVALTTSLSPAALGSYSATLAAFGLADPVVYIILWACAVVPVSLVGFYFVAFKLRDLPILRRVGEGRPAAAVENKLSRSADISSDQAGFLRDYFGGSRLACGIAARDIVGEAAFARYFGGGGSGAVTYLSRRSDGFYVTKVVSAEKSAALREQFAWLRVHEGPQVVRADEEREDSEAYAIDVEYEPDSLDCFDYLHVRPAAEGERLLDSVTELLAGEVWRADDGLLLAEPGDAQRRVEGYIEKHVERSLQLAVEAMPSLSSLIAADEVIVNGERCRNVAELIGEVQGRPVIMGDLCAFRRSSSIHGDLIIDNIIWSPSKGLPVLLDPVPCGNFFDGPVFDFGKLCQSLQVGYEFLLRDRSLVEVRDLGDGNVAVDYPDRRSVTYERLWRYVHDELAPCNLTESERRTMLFLGATNFLRRMKHQVVQCQENAPAFYAAGVLHLERYVRLFER